MSTIVERFESVLQARAVQVDSTNPYGYTSGYLLTLVKNIVKQNPTIEDELKKHISSLEYTVSANADNSDEEVVYFY